MIFAGCGAKRLVGGARPAFVRATVPKYRRPPGTQLREGFRAACEPLQLGAEASSQSQKSS
jgi:hypothetical protein